MMKKWFCVYASAALAALICAAALVFLRFWLGLAVCIAAVVTWGVLFVRFCTVRYEFSDPEVVISGGWLIKYRKTVKRSSIISVSRVSLVKIPVFTVIRTAADTVILFCEFDAQSLKSN